MNNRIINKSKVFVCGDTHQMLDISKLTSKGWPEGKELTKDDFLIILGDSGINWSNDLYNRQDIYLKSWLNEKPWTTLDVLGNHHNYDRLFQQKPIPFYGGRAYHISESIYALERGGYFKFGDFTFFSMGGGFSIDKERRQDHISWWKEELPSYEEMARGLKLLGHHSNKVDFIVTHSCSNRCFEAIDKEYGMSYKDNAEEHSLRTYFDFIEENVTYKEWHFGHFHVDFPVDEKHRCHYNAKPRRIV